MNGSRIRIRLAVAATGFALAASGAARASFPPELGTCRTDADRTVHCNGKFIETLMIAREGDLVVVFGDTAPTTVTPYLGSAPYIAGTSSTTVVNFGLIQTRFDDALQVHSLGGVTVENFGSIEAIGYDSAYDVTAVFARAHEDGLARIRNHGGIIATSDYNDVIGLYGNSARGDVDISNDGGIDAHSGDGEADGIFASGASVGISNSGSVAASSTNGVGARGVDAEAYGQATVANAGNISADATHGLAVGVAAAGDAGAAVHNSGTINASAGQGGTAIGVSVQGRGDVLVENSGTISATDPGIAVAVSMDTTSGISTLDNTGTLLTGSFDPGSVAVRGSDAVDQVFNTGDIHGAIASFGGDDLLANGGGTWYLGNSTSDFGGGDDSIENAAGGAIAIADGGILLGSSGSAGNVFDNAGTIGVNGHGLIDMGTGPVSPVPASNPMALMNNGLIDFLDGSPDDMLTVIGDMGGHGAINADVNLPDGAGDLLYIDGSVADGTIQAINVPFQGIPAGLSSGSADVVAVTGEVGAGAFVGGEVLGYDAKNNFLDLEVGLSRRQAGAGSVFSAAVDVVGLNDAGVLAASVAPGAHRLIDSSIGTWRQRMGVQRRKDGGMAGLSPWLRAFTEKGDIAPRGGGFSAGSVYGFQQENRGREFGMNLNIAGGFNVGLLVGDADGTQHLTDGVGNDRLELHSSGLYGTWVSPGLYVDASWRWMDFDARLMSSAGEQQSSGNAFAFNIEAGYTGLAAGSVAVTPQIQYTRSEIDNIDAMHGTLADFTADGGLSRRVRAGVEFSRTFGGSGRMLWTPYGVVSAVRQEGGVSTFAVTEAFSGTTDIGGTSRMLELGVGAQMHGLSLAGGVHWIDGGALHSLAGGQLALRYTW